MSLFSNKLEPNQWLPFVEAAALEHRYAQRAVESWMNGVAMVDKSRWREDYNPLLSLPRNRDWMNPLATRDESKPNLYDFLDYMGKANDFQSQAIAKVGKPKMLVNHCRTYTAAMMNQVVSHLALNLVFLHWVRNMASLIYCDRNHIHGGTFAPYEKSLEAVDHYMEVFEEESRFHDSLRFGHDISSNKVDLSDSDLIRHVDLVMLERVKLFSIIIEKLEAECSSLLPWVCGESADMDVSSFSFGQV